MTEERRKSDRRIPPAVAQHAIEERAELLARIECLVSKNDTLNRANLELCDQLHSALKSHPSGVVLPEPFEMRPFQTVDQGGTNYKAGFNAALRKVRERLNSPNGSTGVADDRAAFEAAYSGEYGTPVSVLKLLRDGAAYIEKPQHSDRLNSSWWMWKQARAARTDHSAQSVPDGDDSGWVCGECGSGMQTKLDGPLLPTPRDCAHRFMFFGDQEKRRCADCGKQEGE